MAGGQLLFGIVMILVTVILHIGGLVYWAQLIKILNQKKSLKSSKLGTVILLGASVSFIIVLHMISALAWAGLFCLLGEFEGLQQALYFSVVTATTLGYGDITLSERWQLLGSLEAIDGLILFGVSTAFILELMRRLFEETFKPA